MTFREAVKQAKLVLIRARGKSFKTTKKQIMKAVEELDWDKVLEEPTANTESKIYSHPFHWNGVHLYVFCWEDGLVLEVNLTPSYA